MTIRMRMTIRMIMTMKLLLQQHSSSRLTIFPYETPHPEIMAMVDEGYPLINQQQKQ